MSSTNQNNIPSKISIPSFPDYRRNYENWVISTSGTEKHFGTWIANHVFRRKTFLRLFGGMSPGKILTLRPFRMTKAVHNNKTTSYRSLFTKSK